MTIREAIQKRQHREVSERLIAHNDFWRGYYEGWYWASQDVLEFLEQNGFDLDATVEGKDA